MSPFGIFDEETTDWTFRPNSKWRASRPIKDGGSGGQKYISRYDLFFKNGFRSAQARTNGFSLGFVLAFFSLFSLLLALGASGDPAVTRRYLWGKSGELWRDFGEPLGSLWRDFGRLLKALGSFGEAWGSQEPPARSTIYPNSRSTSSAGPY